MLSEQQGLLLRALEPLEEGENEEKVSHQAGDRWLIRGPLEYVPSAKVEVVEERQAIPLDLNEGIYVQDVKTGKVPAGGWEVPAAASSGQQVLLMGRGRVGEGATAHAAARWLSGRCQALSCPICHLCAKCLVLHFRASS